MGPHLPLAFDYWRRSKNIFPSLRLVDIGVKWVSLRIQDTAVIRDLIALAKTMREFGVVLGAGCPDVMPLEIPREEELS